MRGKDDDQAEWDDQPRPDGDNETEQLTADIVSIMAGRTVLPAAILW